jgi:23S rRNA maturation-related 3'-5' exoribonuclease YhaM
MNYLIDKDIHEYVESMVLSFENLVMLALIYDCENKIIERCCICQGHNV